MMRCRGEQQLVIFAGKVGAIARRRDQTALGIDANRNDNTAISPHTAADVANDFPVRQAVIDDEILLQPFRKCTTRWGIW